MHKRAMFKKQSSSDITEYTPIAKALDAEMRVKHLCQDKTGTCQVKSNDVLTLCQSNLKSLLRALHTPLYTVCLYINRVHTMYIHVSMSVVSFTYKVEQSQQMGIYTMLGHKVHTCIMTDSCPLRLVAVHALLHNGDNALHYMHH